MAFRATTITGAAAVDGMVKCFAATGGAWLVDERRVIADGKINLVGMARLGPQIRCHPPIRNEKYSTRAYPAWVKLLAGPKI